MIKNVVVNFVGVGGVNGCESMAPILTTFGGRMSKQAFQRGAYANQHLAIHCHTHKCAKRNGNGTCHVILDPGLWWARGLCTALTTNKRWATEVKKAVQQYALRR